MGEDEIPEVEPVPAWEEPELHEQATACVQWARRVLREAGLGEEVWERREHFPGELRRMIKTLQTHGQMRRINEPGVIWTCVQRLALAHQEDQRQLWLSALVHAWYVEKHNFSQTAGGGA